jgi:FAD/FMN-containing dehydrogenase
MAQAEEGLNIKHDISINVSRIPEFVTETNALLLERFPGARMVVYGHLGDGNLHYNVQAPENEDQARFLNEKETPMNALVYEAVDRYKGSISAEHGVGSLKVDTLPKHKSPVALGMMRAIKQGLDPDNLMNPGRVMRM